MSQFEGLYKEMPTKAGEGSFSSTASSSSCGSGSTSQDLSVPPLGVVHMPPSPMAYPEMESHPSSSSSISIARTVAVTVAADCDVAVSPNAGRAPSRALEPPRRVSSYDDSAFQDGKRGFLGSGAVLATDAKASAPGTLFGGDVTHSSDSSNDELTGPASSTRRPTRDKRRKSSRVRRPSNAAVGSSSLSHSLLLDDYENSRSPLAVRRRASQRELSFGEGSTRRSSSQEHLLTATTPSTSLTRRSSDDFNAHGSFYASPEISSESSPDCSPGRMVGGTSRLQLQQQQQQESQYHKYPLLNSSSCSRTSLSSSSNNNNNSSSNDLSGMLSGSLPRAGSGNSSSFPKIVKRMSSKSCCLTSTLVCMVLVSLAGTVMLTNHAGPMGDIYQVEHSINRPNMYPSAAGLRGRLVQGRWDDKAPSSGVGSANTSSSSSSKNKGSSSQQGTKKPQGNGQTVKPSGGTQAVSRRPKLEMHLPPPISISTPYSYDKLDPFMYGYKGNIAKHAQSHTPPPRIVAMDPSLTRIPRNLDPYPADFSDNTQLYGILPSDDERLSHMEIRSPYSEGDCVPMQDWQTTFHPLCNGMHELPLQHLGSDSDGQLTARDDDRGDATNDFTKYYGRLNAELFGTKGFWRYAWRVKIDHVEKGLATDTVVLKTLKFEHNFEDAHFEHDRVDAVAMERLTSSPHVINVFGFCGHSVLTEYADGFGVGELADKARKTPLERLRIARDIANGLADVHGIDGDGNATFVHLDINPANVVSVGGNLKLNDFNIGIIRRWNTTSNEPCGFPAQYPNPQWRSPEEARNEQHLTEKVDIFSMGHIFFRLICGHEPWNRFEPGGKPSKEEINRKVQDGVMPFIPDEIYNSKDPEVIAIRDAMIGCYSKDPTDRPSAREISKILDRTLNELSKSTTFSKNAGVGAAKRRRHKK